MTSDHQNNEASKSRRDFIQKAALVSLAGAGIMAFGGVIQLPLPKVLKEPSAKFKIGLPELFKLNEYKWVPQKNIFVFRTTEGFRALSAICTHLGCIVSLNEDGFICPCHGSLFDSQGNVLAGPAPRALDWLKMDMSPGGQLMVDQNKKIKFEEVYQA